MEWFFYVFETLKQKIMSKSINRFLIEKGIKSNTQKITILQMVRWVDEWQEQVKNCSIPVVVLSDCDYGHNTLNKNEKPCKLMCCVKKEDYEQ